MVLSLYDQIHEFHVFNVMYSMYSMRWIIGVFNGLLMGLYPLSLIGSNPASLEYQIQLLHHGGFLGC